MTNRLGVVVLLVLLGGGAGAGGYFYVRSLGDTPVVAASPVRFTVARGASMKSTLAQLEKLGVIKNARLAYLHARSIKRTNVRAGDYEVLPQESLDTLLDKLVEGRVRTEQFLLVEGHNRWQVRQALVEQKWLTAADFDRLCDDAAFLKKNRIPGPHCEGYLFPDTYTFARGLAAEQIFEAMFGLFHRNFDAAMASAKPPIQLSPRELVTLASIVEKETGAPQERPRIACVFYNRLIAKPAWRLETDPTVIYAATLADPNFDGNIKRSHLRTFQHPYNTYKVYGLPPGPIANGGLAAFRAVANPDTCADFFFVSKNNGTHEFCPTLDCHNAAVEKWQLQYFRQKR